MERLVSNSTLVGKSLFCYGRILRLQLHEYKQVLLRVSWQGM